MVTGTEFNMDLTLTPNSTPARLRTNVKNFGQVTCETGVGGEQYFQISVLFYMMRFFFIGKLIQADIPSFHVHRYIFIYLFCSTPSVSFLF